MNISYTIIFIIGVTIPIFSQTTKNLAHNFLKKDIKGYCDNITLTENMEKLIKQSPQKLTD